MRWLSPTVPWPARAALYQLVKRQLLPGCVPDSCETLPDDSATRSGNLPAPLLAPTRSRIWKQPGWGEGHGPGVRPQPMPFRTAGLSAQTVGCAAISRPHRGWVLSTHPLPRVRRRSRVERACPAFLAEGARDRPGDTKAPALASPSPAHPSDPRGPSARTNPAAGFSRARGGAPFPSGVTHACSPLPQAQTAARALARAHRSGLEKSCGFSSPSAHCFFAVQKVGRPCFAFGLWSSVVKSDSSKKGIRYPT